MFRKLFEKFERGGGFRRPSRWRWRVWKNRRPVVCIHICSGWDLRIGVSTVDFSAAPSAVQTGLQAIVRAVRVLTIATAQPVSCGAVDSTTSLYSVRLVPASGPNVRLSVDENGLPAGSEKITFGQLSAGPANDKAIATSLQNLAPSGVTIGSTQTVLVRTARDGTSTFSVSLHNANGTTTKITVDSTGAVVSTGGHVGASANTELFSAATSAVQHGLQALASAGTTIDPSQTVTIQKLNATTTLYSVQIADSTPTRLGFAHQGRITVDQNRLPAGEETVLFSRAKAGHSNDQAIASRP